MIIVSDRYGMLANRLWRLSHIIAHSIEHNIKIVNPFFKEYESYFSLYDESPSINITDGNSLLRFLCSNSPKLIKNPWISTFLYKYTFIAKEINLNDEEYLKHSKDKLHMVYGFKARDRKNFAKHSKSIRKLFSVKKSIQNEINQFHDKIDSNYVTVALHIRKGDYKNWRNGTYYFDDSTYLKFAQQIEKQINKKVQFIIYSNEKISPSNFKDINYIEGPGREITDLYSMALCDYILGPPSTYSMWASFYGEKKLYHTTSKDDKVDINKFKVLEDDYFL